MEKIEKKICYIQELIDLFEDNEKLSAVGFICYEDNICPYEENDKTSKSLSNLEVNRLVEKLNWFSKLKDELYIKNTAINNNINKIENVKKAHQ